MIQTLEYINDRPTIVRPGINTAGKRGSEARAIGTPAHGRIYAVSAAVLMPLELSGFASGMPGWSASQAEL
jgi:hypothetical protein